MKNQVLFAVLAVVAACGNAAVVKPEVVDAPVSIDYSDAVFKVHIVERPEDIESAVRDIGTRDNLLFAQTYEKPAVPNQVQTDVGTYRGPANIRLTEIRAVAVGGPQSATWHLIDGGIGRNFASIRFISSIGGGYHFMLLMYGV